MKRAVLILALLLAPAAHAAPKSRASLDQIEREVMCVTCRIPLNIAESPEADRERAFIRTLIRQGKSEDEIKQALVGQYGKRVLATPQGHGIDLAVWLVPVLLVLLGIGLLVALLPRWRRRPPASAPAAPALSPSDSRRLDEELARFDA